uniref:Discoidin domain-containing protein n=1 Tax=Timema douglasi TaxID=61478 RepID=A0A7R8VJV1_TIMDO|nr:unnamed protein product [Timema douglasi]
MVGHVGDRVTEMVSHAGDIVREMVVHIGDRMREMVGHLGDRVREMVGHVGDSEREMMKVFSEANIMFSVGGRYYVGEPITYTYIEDRIFENSRNISIKLHHRVGRFVKLQLHFAAKWIMISEVTFDSAVELNTTNALANYATEVAQHTLSKKELPSTITPEPELGEQQCSLYLAVLPSSPIPSYVRMRTTVKHHVAGTVNTHCVFTPIDTSDDCARHVRRVTGTDL